jgi:hypothetical protein
MNASWVRYAGLAAVVAVAGCEAERPPPAPMPTDGPNQVVFYVPGMS